MSSFHSVSNNTNSNAVGLTKKYATRPFHLESTSFHDWFYLTKNQNFQKRKKPSEEVHSRGAIVPIYVGISDVSKYPIRANYARTMLFVYKHWRPGDVDDADTEPIKVFKEFIDGNNAPKSLLIQHHRSIRQYQQKLKNPKFNTDGYEPVSDDMEINDDLMDDSDQKLVSLLGRHGALSHELNLNLERGRDFDWSKRRIEVSLLIPCDQSNDVKTNIYSSATRTTKTLGSGFILKSPTMPTVLIILPLRRWIYQKGMMALLI